MNTHSTKSGEQGASKPAPAAFKSGLEDSMWASEAEEKTTVGDRPVETPSSHAARLPDQSIRLFMCVCVCVRVGGSPT